MIVRWKDSLLTCLCFLLFVTGTMMLELQEKVTELENWKEGKGLIIRGAENTFCSGSDLNVVKALSSMQVSNDKARIPGEKGASQYFCCNYLYFLYSPFCLVM